MSAVVTLRGRADCDDPCRYYDTSVLYQANPSLGYTIDIEKVSNAYLSAKDNPAEENIFRQLRLN